MTENNNDVGDKTPPNVPDYHEDLAFPPKGVRWTPPTSDIVELQERLKKTQELELQVRRENTKIANDCHTLVQTLFKVSPEHREWLEKNFSEYVEQQKDWVNGI